MLWVYFKGFVKAEEVSDFASTHESYRESSTQYACSIQALPVQLMSAADIPLLALSTAGFCI